jgi:hypothetical protein
MFGLFVILNIEVSKKLNFRQSEITLRQAQCDFLEGQIPNTF